MNLNQVNGSRVFVLHPFHQERFPAAAAALRLGMHVRYKVDQWEPIMEAHAIEQVFAQRDT